MQKILKNPKTTKKPLHSKETINKIKRHPIEWEKMYAGHMSDKELIPEFLLWLSRLRT